MAINGFTQELPDELRGILNKQIPIVSEVDLTSQQKDFLWKETYVDDAGFLRIEVPKDYLGIIQEMIRTMPKETLNDPNSNFANLFLNDGFNQISFVSEDSYKNNRIYSANDGSLLMLSLWNYEKSGSHIVQVDQFLNVQLGDIKATLALAFSTGDNACLWKLQWVSAGINYELYTKDDCGKDGKPKRNPKTILQYGRTVIDASTTK